jgi:hypothetical protein
MWHLRYPSSEWRGPKMDVEAGLTAEQKNAGYVLPCVGRAQGEGTVVLAA